MKRTTYMTQSIVAMTTASCLAIGGVASAQEDEQDLSKGIGRQKSQQLDARLLARLYDASPEVSLKHANESRKFAALAEGLSRKYKDTFAGATWGERPGDPAMVRFVGSPPDTVRKQISRLPFKVRVQGGAERSATKQHDLAVRTHDVLRKAGFDQVAVVPETDGSISATAWSKRGAKVPQLPVDAKVEVQDEPIAADLHSRGGGNMLDGGFRECTSAFSVITPSGETGISTAGHCNGLDQYQEPDTGTTYNMDYRSGHYGFWGDYEWHSTPTHVDPAEYFARTNEIRDVNSVSGWLPVGTPTCLFGQTSDVRWCDTIKYQDVVATFSGPTHHFLTLNTGSEADPGDSGGPVSFATEADGLIKGYMTKGSKRRDVWVRASLMPIAIGVSVRTK